MDIETKTKDAQVIKGVILKQLREDGILSQEQFDEYNEKWVIFFSKAGWFENWFKKYSPIVDTERWMYSLQKIED